MARLVGMPVSTAEKVVVQKDIKGHMNIVKEIEDYLETLPGQWSLGHILWVAEGEDHQEIMVFKVEKEL